MEKLYKSFIFCLLKTFLFRGTKLLIISFILAYAFTNKIDHPSISDNLIESIYYKGKKTSKITYDELKIQGKIEVLKKCEFQEKQLESNTQESCIEEKCIHHKVRLPDLSKEEFINEKNGIYNQFSEKIKDNSKYDSNEIKSSEIDNLYSIYGTKSIYNMDLLDLENFVNSSILTEKEAIDLWNSLIKKGKIKRSNSIYDDENSNKEIYLFRFIPIKSIALLIITMIVVGIIFRIAKISFLASLTCMILSYYMLDDFYKSRYYNISVIILGSFVYSLQQFYYQYLNYLGFNKEDYEISSDKVKNKTQFILKLTILLLIVVIIGLFTFLKYDCFVNYFVLYFGIVKLILLIAYYINKKVSYYFQPILNVLIMLFALVNFFLTNFHTKIKRFHRDLIFSPSNPWRNLDSFYLISQTFSVYSLSFLYEYLFTQSSNVSKYLVYKYTDTEKFLDYLEKIKRDYKEQFKYLTTNDCLWHIVFLIGIIIFFTAVYNNQYLSFIIALFYTHVILNVVNKIFKHQMAASIFSFFILLSIVMNEFMCKRLKENVTFLQISESIEIYTGYITKETTYTIIKILGISHLFLLFLINREFLCDEPYDYLYIEEHPDKIVLSKKDKNQYYNESFQKYLCNVLDFISSYYNFSFIFYVLLKIENNKFVIGIYFILLCLLFYRVIYSI